MTLLFAQVGNFDPGTCAPVAVDGYRVYPPDETAAVFVADPQQACSVTGVGVPGVGPVKPGRHAMTGLPADLDAMGSAGQAGVNAAEMAQMKGRSAAVRAEWQELFAAEYPRLAGWAWRLVGNDEIAHEIASEAFTRLMSRWERADNPHAYLYKVAVNLVRDHWRRTKRERQVLGAVTADHRDELGRPAYADSDLRALLEPLPERQRTAVVLHYLAGFPVREVALMVGRPEGTVKSDLHQARLRLRVALEATDV